MTLICQTSIILNKNGQIEIVLAHSPDVLKEKLIAHYSQFSGKWNEAVLESLLFHLFLTDFASGLQVLPFKNPVSDPSVYLIGSNLFNVDRDNKITGLNYGYVTTSFLKK